MSNAEVQLGILISFVILGFGAVMWYKKQQKLKQKSRMFDIEIAEKETHEKINSLDPDSLIDEANKFMGSGSRNGSDDK